MINYVVGVESVDLERKMRMFVFFPALPRFSLLHYIIDIENKKEKMKNVGRLFFFLSLPVLVVHAGLVGV